MSRTMRTMPRWVSRYITEDNQLKNGYRQRTWRDNFISKRWTTESLVVEYGTDNAMRDLRNCRNSLPNGKACGWYMQCAHTQLSKRIVRKQWARANRRHSQMVVADEMIDYYDDAPLNYPIIPDADYVDDEEWYVDEDYAYIDAAYNRGYGEGYHAGYEAAMRHFNINHKETA